MDDKDVTFMEIAVANARRLLVLWGSGKESIEEIDDDGTVLAMALVVADRAVARHEAGMEYRPPCD